MRKIQTRSKSTKRFVLMAVLGVLGIFVIFSIPLKVRSVTYEAPSGSPPVSDSSAALNVSSSIQTKIGGLTLNNGLTIGNNSNLNVFGDVCWNGVCKNSWAEVSGVSAIERFVKLISDPTDPSGWADLTGSDNATTLKLNSPVPTFPAAAPGVDAGVFGQDDGSSASASYGVAGYASRNSDKSYGIYGTSSATSPSWAGYFAGNVAVSPDNDLIVGGSITQGNDSNVSELCINDVCRSEILLTGDQYWTVSGNDLQVADTGLNLAVGGKDSRASFFVQNNASRLNVTLKVNGVGNSADLSL